MVFEGSDGAGKSTQIKLLAQKLAAEGRKVVLLREPGGTEPGEEMRHILKHGNYNLSPRAELLLMNASRAQLVDAVILPALARGEDVLLDRFFYSTIAYQGYGRNLPLPTVRSVINAAVGELQPDHVFLLRIPLEVCLERRGARQGELPNMGKDRFEKEDVEFFTRVEQGYAQIAAADPQHVHVIDATRGPQEVFDEVCKHLLIESIEVEKASSRGQRLRLVTVLSSHMGQRTMRSRLLKEPLPLGMFTQASAPQPVLGALKKVDADSVDV